MQWGEFWTGICSGGEFRQKHLVRVNIEQEHTVGVE